MIMTETVETLIIRSSACERGYTAKGYDDWLNYYKALVYREVIPSLPSESNTDVRWAAAYSVIGRGSSSISFAVRLILNAHHQIHEAEKAFEEAQGNENVSTNTTTSDRNIQAKAMSDAKHALKCVNKAVELWLAETMKNVHFIFEIVVIFIFCFDTIDLIMAPSRESLKIYTTWTGPLSPRTQWMVAVAHLLSNALQLLSKKEQEVAWNCLVS